MSVDRVALANGLQPLVLVVLRLPGMSLSYCATAPAGGQPTTTVAVLLVVMPFSAS
jgi:hypothetical protein